MIQFGNDKIKDIYVGSDKIKEVYYGSEKVWGEIESVGDGYWVHKNTGAKTYFGSDADFITGGIMSPPPWRPDCSEVNIPEGVTSLGDRALNLCPALTSITLPDSLTSIGVDAFFFCPALTSITLPESLTSIGAGAFSGCASLSLVTSLPTIPPTLGSSVFNNTHANLIIKVPAQSVNAYKTATNWITYASKISAIPEPGYWVHKDTGVKTYFGLDDPSIEGGIMSPPSWKNNCSEVNIPEGVTSLGARCFYECKSLTSITLPEGVTSLGDSCFEYCPSLTSITLPEGVTSLGRYCFLECYALTPINIPAGVTSLGYGCFAWCESLTSITLPESVTILGAECFYGCTSLTLATVLPATPPTLGDIAFDEVHPSFNIKVRSPYVNAYKAATNWKNYGYLISAI